VEEKNETRRPIAGPEKGTDVEVRVTGLLARCFHANPNFVDLFPDQRARTRVLPRMFAAGLRDALRLGQVCAATRGRDPCGKSEPGNGNPG
jgi:hypothetical protein